MGIGAGHRDAPFFLGNSRMAIGSTFCGVPGGQAEDFGLEPLDEESRVFQHKEAGVGNLDFHGNFTIDSDIVFEKLAHVGASGKVVPGLQAGFDEAVGFELFFGKLPDGEDVVVLVHFFQFCGFAGLGFGFIPWRQ